MNIELVLWARAIKDILPDTCHQEIQQECPPGKFPKLGTSKIVAHVAGVCTFCSFPIAQTEPSREVIPGFLNRSAVYALQQATLPGAVDYEQPRRQVRNPAPRRSSDSVRGLEDSRTIEANLLKVTSE